MMPCSGGSVSLGRMSIRVPYGRDVPKASDDHGNAAAVANALHELRRRATAAESLLARALAGAADEAVRRERLEERRRRQARLAAVALVLASAVLTALGRARRRTSARRAEPEGPETPEQAAADR